MAEYQFLELDDGTQAFRKFQRAGSGDRFTAEANGLEALAATGTVTTPRVLAASDRELLTERINSGDESTRGWQTLGSQLARLQAIAQPAFGFTIDNYCGDTRQYNPTTDDGFAFFAEHRLGFQGRLAFDAGLLARDELALLDGLCAKLETLIPAQQPALLHGDLWRGNVLFNEQGNPVLIDPACYWGWPEAEIAMCSLFGGFPEDFFGSWENAAQPESGWRDRLPLYNLYHLLNHLNLFGNSYHQQVVAVLRRYQARSTVADRGDSQTPVSQQAQ